MTDSKSRVSHDPWWKILGGLFVVLAAGALGATIALEAKTVLGFWLGAPLLLLGPVFMYVTYRLIFPRRD